MKVSELTGAHLALWVARCEGVEASRGVKLYASGPCLYSETPQGGGIPFDYRPDSRWAHGGPIIERDQISLNPPSVVHVHGGPNSGWHRYDHWRATVSARTRKIPPNDTQRAMSLDGGVGRGEGDTPLIAAMRAKVASHYGDEVPND